MILILVHLTFRFTCVSECVGVHVHVCAVCFYVGLYREI